MQHLAATFGASVEEHKEAVKVSDSHDRSLCVDRSVRCRRDARAIRSASTNVVQRAMSYCISCRVEPLTARHMWRLAWQRQLLKVAAEILALGKAHTSAAAQNAVERTEEDAFEKASLDRYGRSG